MHKLKRLREEERMWPERKEEKKSVILRKVWEKVVSNTEEVSRHKCHKAERGLGQNHWV